MIVRPPAPGSEAERCANYAPDEWAPVLDAEGRLARIIPSPGPRNVDTALVTGGRLVAEDRGEFGGEVRWEPSGGPAVQVARLNLRGFVRTKAELLGLAGLAHLSTDTGEVVRFRRDSVGSWRVEPLVGLGSAPQAFALLPGHTLLVATSKGLTLATEHGGARPLHRAGSWWLTYANSVARGAGGAYYVGMRSAVARLTPAADGYREEWLVPDMCSVRALVDGEMTECTCRRQHPTFPDT